MNTIKTIAVFCGSSVGKNPLYEQKAIDLGTALYANQIGLVYGGGNRGLMGVIAKTVFKLGGSVTGVLPEALNLASVRQAVVETELIVVPTMHERKAKMYSLADAFIALPGGIGTFEEFLEVFTWLQLGYHHKPVALLNTAGFYNPLLHFFQQSSDEGFLHKDLLEALVVEEDENMLLRRIQGISLTIKDKLAP
ncbi:MAG: TIGR00730 family Rossman fold protein [Sphaerochaeta sp.]|nr:TIGR00730 family Rossman fold protein [Sphaerochaeta sp.]